MRLWTSQFLGMLFMPLFGTGNGAQRLEKSKCVRGIIWVLHGMSGIPSAPKFWRWIKIPTNIARFSTEVSFYCMTLTWHLKAKCYFTLRISTFWVSSRMIFLPTFKAWEIWMLHPWYSHRVISIWKKMKVNAEGAQVPNAVHTNENDDDNCL